jgi:hypothetical protein
LRCAGSRSTVSATTTTDNATLVNEGDIRVGTDLGGDTGPNYTGILIEQNVIGSGPLSLADPGLGNRSVSGVVIVGADAGTIQNNVIGFAGRFGAFVTNEAEGWLIEANDFRRNALENDHQDSLDLGNRAGTATVRRNYFFQSDGGGLDSWRGDGGNIIENNTFEGNGQGGTEPAAMRLFGANNTVRYNLVQNNVGAGVLVVADVTGPASTIRPLATSSPGTASSPMVPTQSTW